MFQVAKLSSVRVSDFSSMEVCEGFNFIGNLSISVADLIHPCNNAEEAVNRLVGSGCISASMKSIPVVLTLRFASSSLGKVSGCGI